MSHQLQIAFAVNNNYAKYLGATLLSLLDHHPQDELVVHVLYKELDVGLLDDLRIFAASQSNLDLVLHPIHQADFLGIPVRTQQFPLESFCRFLLPDLLPDVERVLYLDVDILVKGSLRSLFELDMAGKELGAVRESDIYAYYQWYLDSLGFSVQDDYFSSGVLLMDLAAMRQAGTSRKLLEMALEKAHDLKFPDQDILNTHYRGDILLLSPAYNYTDRRKLDQELPADQVIIEHFNGDIKAWQALSKIPDYLKSSVATYQLCQSRYRALLDKPLVSLLVKIKAYDDFVKACLESLAEQTYANVQFILAINPEDQALSAFLAPYLADPRFVVCTEWPELSDQLGVAVGFVAPDATLDPYYVERLLDSLEGSGADVAVTSFVVFSQQNGIYRIYPETLKEGQIWSAKDLTENLYRQAWLETEVHRSLYGKLYRPHLFQLIKSRSTAEPTQLALDLYLAANQVVLASQRLYMQRFYGEHEMVLDSSEAIETRLAELVAYRQRLSEVGYSTLLFDTAYDTVLSGLRQRAQELGVDQLVQQITSRMADHRLVLQLGKV